MKTTIQEEQARNHAGSDTTPRPSSQESWFAPKDPTSPLRKLKQILVPIDFSDASLKALRYAVPFAEQFGATLSLVHIIEPMAFASDVPYAPPVVSDEEAEEAARKKLFSLASHEIQKLVQVKVHVRSGTAFVEILDAARSLEADLVIIATHGYTGLKHFLLGSTAERIVRHAHCPVLTVRLA